MSIDLEALLEQLKKEHKALEIIKNHIKIHLSFFDGNLEHTRYSAEMTEISQEEHELLNKVLL